MLHLPAIQLRSLAFLLALTLALVACSHLSYHDTEVGSDELAAIELAKPVADAYLGKHLDARSTNRPPLGLEYDLHYDSVRKTLNDDGSIVWSDSKSFCPAEYYVDVTDLDSGSGSRSEVLVLVSLSPHRALRVDDDADYAQNTPSPMPTPCIDGSLPRASRFR